MKKKVKLPKAAAKLPRKAKNAPRSPADPYTEVLIALDQIKAELIQLRNEITKTWHDECCPKVVQISNELGRLAGLKLIAEDKARRLTCGLK